MEGLFKSLEIQEEFNKNGFVRIPFLTPAQADRLMGLYQTIEAEHQQIGLPFTTTSHSNNDELIRKADGYIAEIFAPEMDKLLHDYKLIFGNFLVKKTGPDSVTPPHQDTTFVDETRHSSISVWISLEDTDHRNGCMRFIKGSHKFKYSLRPTHAYPWAFEKVADHLERLLTDYPSQKGEAFIFDHGVIHASYANLGSTPRVAAVMAAYPADADLLLLFRAKDDERAVEKYKMTKEAYLHFVKGEPPAMGELLGIEYYDFTQITPGDLSKMIPKLPSVRRTFKEYLSIFMRSRSNKEIQK